MADSGIEDAEPVAVILWEEVGYELSRKPLFKDQRLYFGRDESCAIRFGHFPMEVRSVPRQWGEMSLHHTFIVVTNHDERWPLLLSVPEPEDGHTDGRVDHFIIQPGQIGGLQQHHFNILGLGEPQRPDGTPFRIEVRVSEYLDYPVPTPIDSEPSFSALKWRETDKRIAQAILKLDGERARRPTQAEIADKAGFATITVRNRLEYIADQFLFLGFVSESERGQTNGIDIVVTTLRRLPSIVPYQ